MGEECSKLGARAEIKGIVTDPGMSTGGGGLRKFKFCATILVFKISAAKLNTFNFLRRN